MDVLTLMDWMPKLHAMQCCVREYLLALNGFFTFTFSTNCIKMKGAITVVLSRVGVSRVNIAVATGSAGCNIKYFGRVTEHWRGFGDNGSVWCLMLVGIGMEILILLLLVGMSPQNGVEAWGNEGHYSICKIAEPLLSEEASMAVKKLLPEYAEGDLASLCSWADHMRFHYPWGRHNAEGEIGMCLEGAIKTYTSQLETYGSRADREKYNLTEALLFLSHFIGDVHQPLHVGFVTDEGGNTIILHWYRQKSNLHHIWDTLMIETAMKDFYDDDLEVMISSIQRNITDSWSDEVPTWEKCNGHDLACPKVYADESIILACKWAYKDAEANSVLEDDYFLSRLPIVEKQLAKAGVRLAATLNRLFNSKDGYNRKSEF